MSQFILSHVVAQMISVLQVSSVVPSWLSPRGATFIEAMEVMEGTENS